MRKKWPAMLLGLVAAAYLLAPPVWMLISSVSLEQELLNRPPHWIPREPTLVNYLTLLHIGSGRQVEIMTGVRHFTGGLRNSVLLSVGVVAVSLAIGSFTAYSVARFLPEAQRRRVLLTLLGIRMIPLITVLLPLYVMTKAVGLLDSLTGLGIVHIGLALPYVIWMLEAFFQSLPRDLEDAAMVDGCSRVTAFTRIVLPLMGPGLFATGAFIFITVWGDFLVAVVLTTSPQNYPLTVVSSMFAGMFQDTAWGLLSAAGVYAVAVPLALAFIFQRYVIGGLTAGALKG
ncbi:MAG: carbohydrate ABC transporter permease [Armatimonadetes bacterium]|nr:carbohydrate ABC transporter permease [Armatimonadota bacterium]